MRRNQQIHAEAAEWFVEFEGEEVGSHQRREFDRWLRRSPEHVQAFLELLPVWERGAAKRPEAADPEALIAQALEAEAPVAPLPFFRAEAPRRPRRRVALAAAIGLAVIPAALVTWHILGGSTYSTGIAEQRSIVLDDGSALELNARSRVRIRFSDHQRQVELLEGQALFRVAHAADRPFVVLMDHARVKVIGTQFDVNRHSRKLIVTVLEGRVAVGPSAEASPTLVSAGEQTTVTSKGVEPPAVVDIDAATAWTKRQLTFRKAALSDVVEEFNRFNRRQLRIEQPALRDFLVSGTFASTDPGSFLKFLAEQPGVRVIAREREILISAP